MAFAEYIWLDGNAPAQGLRSRTGGDVRVI